GLPRAADALVRVLAKGRGRREIPGGDGVRRRDERVAQLRSLAASGGPDEAPLFPRERRPVVRSTHSGYRRRPVCVGSGASSAVSTPPRRADVYSAVP